MKIVIVGAGDVGKYLCKVLSEDGHSVTLIESDEATVTEVEENLDVRVVKGNGASAKHLTLAGAQLEGKAIEEAKQELLEKIEEYFTEKE